MANVAYDKNGNGVRFIRMNGRIVPIRDKGVPSNARIVERKRSAAATIAKSTIIGGAALAGLGAASGVGVGLGVFGAAAGAGLGAIRTAFGGRSTSYHVVYKNKKLSRKKRSTGVK